MTRPIYEIAAEIRRTWDKPYFGARPYLDAMQDLEGITDKYYADDARGIVAYFLGNAKTWRGEDAKRIKAELRELIK